MAGKLLVITVPKFVSFKTSKWSCSGDRPLLMLPNAVLLSDFRAHRKAKAFPERTWIKGLVFI